jgi:hypothetical protein
MIAPVAVRCRALSDGRLLRRARMGDVGAAFELRRRHGPTGVRFAEVLGTPTERAWTAILEVVAAPGPTPCFVAAYLGELARHVEADHPPARAEVVAALGAVGWGWLAGPVLGIDGVEAAGLLSEGGAQAAGPRQSTPTR